MSTVSQAETGTQTSSLASGGSGTQRAAIPFSIHSIVLSRALCGYTACRFGAKIYDASQPLRTYAVRHTTCSGRSRHKQSHITPWRRYQFLMLVHADRLRSNSTRFVADLLYSLLYNKSTTNRISGVLLDNSWIANLRTGRLADRTSRGVAGEFACLVFVLFAASARPPVVQSASWQYAGELSSYLPAHPLLKLQVCHRLLLIPL